MFGSLLLFRVESAVRRRFAARKLPSESSDVPQHGIYLGGAPSQLPTLLELHGGHGPLVRGTAGRLPVGCGRAGYGGTREPAFVARNFKKVEIWKSFLMRVRPLEKSSLGGLEIAVRAIWAGAIGVVVPHFGPHFWWAGTSSHSFSYCG